MKYFRIHGKGGKRRYVPCHSGTLERIDDYLALSGRGVAEGGALFRPVKNSTTDTLDEGKTRNGNLCPLSGHGEIA